MFLGNTSRRLPSPTSRPASAEARGAAGLRRTCASPALEGGRDRRRAARSPRRSASGPVGMSPQEAGDHRQFLRPGARHPARRACGRDTAPVARRCCRARSPRRCGRPRAGRGPATLRRPCWRPTPRPRSRPHPAAGGIADPVVDVDEQRADAVVELSGDRMALAREAPPRPIGGGVGSRVSRRSRRRSGGASRARRTLGSSRAASSSPSSNIAESTAIAAATAAGTDLRRASTGRLILRSLGHSALARRATRGAAPELGRLGFRG